MQQHKSSNEMTNKTYIYTYTKHQFVVLYLMAVAKCLFFFSVYRYISSASLSFSTGVSHRGGAIGAPPHWLCTSIAINEKS